MSRILIDARAVRQPPDGISRYTLELAQALVAATDAVRWVFLFRPGVPLPEWVHRPHVEVVQVGAHHLSPFTLWRLEQIVIEQRVDLFHSPFFLSPLKLPCPKIVTVHDLMALTYPGFFGGHGWWGEWARAAWHRWAVPRSVKSADLILTDAEPTRQEVMRRFGLGADQVQVLPVPVSNRFHGLSGVTPEAEEWAARNLPHSYILHLSNWKPYKNPLGVLRGYAAYREKRGKWALPLVMAGGGERGRELVLAERERLGLQLAVSLLERVPEAYLPVLYHRARVFFFPSLEEGFGLPALEAAACGAVVVASPCGALPEVLSGAAWWVDPRDATAMGAALFEAECRDDVRQELLPRVPSCLAPLRPEKLAVKLLRIYNQLLPRP